MLAIYKRELKSYMHSFIGFLFIGVTLFFVGLYFVSNNIFGAYPYFSYTVSSVVFIFMISVPILTMRSLSEERKTKTDQLILTAPISVGKIVLGKYLALVSIFAVAVLITCTYPLIMSQFGTVPMGESYLAILAFFLYGSTCIAIGVFVSSLTESPVIAAVIGFGLLFLGYMMTGICSMVSNELLVKILRCYDLYTPFVNLLEGTLNLTSVVYFVSVTGLFLFLTTQSIQKRRYSVSVKSLNMSAYSTGMIAIVAVITVFVNIIFSEMPATWTSIDVSFEQLYSLTDQTKDFVKNLDEDVTIYVMANEENKDNMVAQTLEKYDALSEHITVEYVDPNVNPKFHTQYTNSITWGTLIVVGENRNKVIPASDLYAKTIVDYTTYESATTGYDGEGQITSALDYVTSENIPQVYLTSGHGESTLSSNFKDALAKENVVLETIHLMDSETVPEDAACLVINGPATDFSEDDLDKVIAYLNNGGKVVAITTLTEDELPNYDKLLAYMGLEVTENIVIEGDEDFYYQSPAYLLPDMSYSPYTTGVYSSYYAFVPYAQGIIVEEEANADIEYDQFMVTSEDAYVKMDLASDTIAFEEGDIKGPFAIGVEAVKALENGEATMVVYSCSEMFTDNASQMVSGTNQVILVNTISSFVDHEGSVSVPVKNYEVSYLSMTQADALLIGAIVVILLPLSCLIAGFVIWFVRRKR